MKTVSLLLPIALLIAIAVVFLPSRPESGEAHGDKEDPDVRAAEFDDFVQTVGLDVSTMSTGLRREAIISGRQRSLPLCALSEKQANNARSPLEVFALGAGLDVSKMGNTIGPAENGSNRSGPLPALDELTR